MAHGMIDRFTADVDLFTDLEAGVVVAADAVEAALRDAGFEADRQDKTGGLADIFEGMGEGLAEWVITAPTGEQMMLQMAYFDRSRGPVTMDVGPVLDLEDVIGGKVCALASRAYERDYVDTAAALERFSVDQVIAFARRLDPGLEDRDFSEAGPGGWTGWTMGHSPASGSARVMSSCCESGSPPGRGSDRQGGAHTLDSVTGHHVRSDTMEVTVLDRRDHARPDRAPHR